MAQATSATSATSAAALAISLCGMGFAPADAHACSPCYVAVYQYRSGKVKATDKRSVRAIRN